MHADMLLLTQPVHFLGKSPRGIAPFVIYDTAVIAAPSYICVCVCVCVQAYFPASLASVYIAPSDLVIAVLGVGRHVVCDIFSSPLCCT